MTDDTDRALLAHATLVVHERRLRELWGYRVWFRRYPWAANVFDRQELNVELRALVRLLREARRVAREAQERADPVTESKALADLAHGDWFAGMSHLPSSKAAAGTVR